MANEFPIEFKRCPNCGSQETICRLAWRQVKGELREGLFVSLDKRVTPLAESFVGLTAITVPAVITHKDVCAKCGLEYCTKAEIQNIPIQVVVPGSPGRG